MNSELIGDGIILNDTFQTQKTALATIAADSVGYQSIGTTIPNQEVLTFNVEDFHKIGYTSVSGEYEIIASYQYAPEQSIDNPFIGPVPGHYANNLANDDIAGQWNYYHYGPNSNLNTNNFVIEINNDKNKPICDEYPGLTNSLLLSTTPNSLGSADNTFQFFYFPLSKKDQENLPDIGVGACEFTIGFLPIKFTYFNDTATDLNRDCALPDYFPTDNQNIKSNIKLKPGVTELSSINDYVADFNWFKDTANKDALGMGLSFGKYNTNDSSEFKYRFRLGFITEFNTTENKWEVWLTNYINNSSNTKICLIPGWDGLTLRKFRFYFSPDNLDENLGESNKPTGSLYYLENDNEILIADDIGLNSTTAISNMFPGFGSFGNMKTCCLAVQQFKYIMFQQPNVHNFTFDNEIYTESNGIKTDTYMVKNAIKKEVAGVLQYNFKCADTSTGNVKVHWEFLDKISLVPATETTVDIINDWEPDNLTTVDEARQFAKKDKKIKLIADAGTITEFSNPNKCIHNINTTQITNLTKLDVSNNLLTTIDLSKNLYLTDINVSGNERLKKVILPSKLNNNSLTIDISDCPNLTSLILPQNQISNKTLTINANGQNQINNLEINNTLNILSLPNAKDYTWVAGSNATGIGTAASAEIIQKLITAITNEQIGNTDLIGWFAGTGQNYTANDYGADISIIDSTSFTFKSRPGLGGEYVALGVKMDNIVDSITLSFTSDNKLGYSLWGYNSKSNSVASIVGQTNLTEAGAINVTKNISSISVDYLFIVWNANPSSGAASAGATVKISNIELRPGLLPVTISVNSEQPFSSLEKITLRNAFFTNDILPNSIASCEKLAKIDISETNILKSVDKLTAFLTALPDRTSKTPGVIYLYGEKYTINGVKGSAAAIGTTLEALKNKNWLFYL